MKDTPNDVEKLHLQIWLSKTPEERLRQTIEDNEALFAFWEHAKAELASENNKSTEIDKL